ncbi:MAG: glycosyltransferase [Patescibacteria group bacterium]
MKISVIIPTLNEEKYLPKLLGDLKKQTFTDFEVIVADAFSKDKTRKIAESYGAKVVDGGMPAVARNAGAKVARGDFLYFLDADVRVKKDFLEKSYFEIEDRFLDLATCDLVPISDLMIDKVFHQISNIFIKLQQYSDPIISGCCILVSRRLFEKIGGFDEKLKLAEDHNFAKRAAVWRKMGVLFDTDVMLSVRRLRKEGRVGYAEMVLKTVVYRGLIGEIKDDLIKYDFGEFERNNNGKVEKILIRYDKKLSLINKQINKMIKNGRKDNVWLDTFSEQGLLFKKQYLKMLEGIKKLVKIK